MSDPGSVPTDPPSEGPVLGPGTRAWGAAGLPRGFGGRVWGPVGEAGDWGLPLAASGAAIGFVRG